MKVVFRRTGLAACLAALPAAAFAADTEPEHELREMVVKGSAPVAAAVSSTVESVTAQQIQENINAVTSGHVLKYQPSLQLRERYIGDRNASIGSRMSNVNSSAHSMVYSDGILLSNYVGNSLLYSPRWGMVAPEEIERVDFIYGPFSALYPGNSMGVTANFTTRMPEKFEAHGAIQYFQEEVRSEYRTNKSFPSYNANVSLGNRAGDWSFWVGYNRLDSNTAPSMYGTATPKPGPGGVEVSGAMTDRDALNNPRVITGAISAERTIQDQGKLKLAYDFSPNWQAAYTLGLWQNSGESSSESYLRNAAGQTIYNTTPSGPYQYVRINGQRYTVSSVTPRSSEDFHWMQALSLKSKRKENWDAELNFSVYRYAKDESRNASNTGLDSGQNGGRGTLTDRSGTGWENLDLRGEWRPDGKKGAHKLHFGYHFDRYTFKSDTGNVDDWRSGGIRELTAASRGKTNTHALYLQDTWRFAPAWSLTLGGRWEHWQAYDGSNANRASTPSQVSYSDRKKSAFSPKLSLGFQAAPDWHLRASLGKATRFPTVTELFQAITTGPNRLENDPNLQPERVRSGELAIEKSLDNGQARLSLFQEYRYDALISQTDTTVTPNITSIQNVDKVRSRGVELSWGLNDVGIHGLDLNGSVTYAQSIIRENHRNPDTVGNWIVRIPRWRATLVSTYRVNDKLSLSLSARYSGRQYNRMDNLDVNPDTYGGASRYLIADAKMVYRFHPQLRFSLGINNLNDEKAYIGHPYPRRMYFAGLAFDY